MTEREVEILKDQLYGMTEDDLWWVPEKDLEGEPVDLSELNAFGLHLEEENQKEIHGNNEEQKQCIYTGCLFFLWERSKNGEKCKRND